MEALALVVIVAAAAWFLMHKTPLEYAQSQIGVQSSGGRFQGPPFQLYALPGEQPLAWCARLMRWCWTQAGKRLPGNPYLIGSVAILRDACVDAGCFFGPDFECAAGDLMFLQGVGSGEDGIEFGGHHVCIVEFVDEDGVHTIDGDFGTPDRVMRIVRPKSQRDIWGYARVP